MRLPLYLLSSLRRDLPRRGLASLSAPLHLHVGCSALPPMVQADGSAFGLDAGLVRPPDADALWEWLVATGRDARDPDPSWGEVWGSARALAAFVRRGDARVDGARVVDLGCGLGVVGINAALAGASSVCFVDREPEALHCAMASAALNGVATGARGDPGVVASAAVGAFGSADAPAADVVLASDVLYAAADMPALAAACGRLAPRAIIADPAAGRAVGARDAFVRAAERLGATVTELAVEPPRDTPEPGEPTILLSVDWSPKAP